MSIFNLRCFTTRPSSSESNKIVQESDRWQFCTFLHNGAGVVSVGEAQSVGPATSGAGCQLMTGVLQPIWVPPGKALYIICNNEPQNVSVTITEIPDEMVPAAMRGR